jgi:hypothetical protein
MQLLADQMGKITIGPGPGYAEDCPGTEGDVEQVRSAVGLDRTSKQGNGYDTACQIN